MAIPCTRDHAAIDATATPRLIHRLERELRVQLRGGALLRALQVCIGTVDQLWPMHDREVPSMLDREQDVRHADGGEVTVCCGILECVSKEPVTFAGQSCEDALPAPCGR